MLSNYVVTHARQATGQLVRERVQPIELHGQNSRSELR